ADHALKIPYEFRIGMRAGGGADTIKRGDVTSASGIRGVASALAVVAPGGAAGFEGGTFDERLLIRAGGAGSGGSGSGGSGSGGSGSGRVVLEASDPSRWLAPGGELHPSMLASFDDEAASTNEGRPGLGMRLSGMVKSGRGVGRWLGTAGSRPKRSNPDLDRGGDGDGGGLS
ncbi:MAG: hypothetical protein AAF235_11445, partial [Planctomycetota bacterium]